MTVSVSNDDDDEEAKRFAFPLSFVTASCNGTSGAVRGLPDHAFARFTLLNGCFCTSLRVVRGTTRPAGVPARVTSGLILV